MEYRLLSESDITAKLFDGFIRRQVVTDCVRKIDGKWQILSDPFIDDWDEADYIFLRSCLNNTIRSGGVVFGAFSSEGLKGFCSVEGELFGLNREYLDLSSLHVSLDVRRKGVGEKLFYLAKAWAKAKGAKKLYISAHSAVESQAFYKAMGCVEALEYNSEHVSREPCDCQLECHL